MWTPEASQRKYAVSDGFLKVVAEEDLDEQELWQVIGEAERNTWRLLHKNAVEDTLANWEFRGLSIESDSVMDGVMRLAREGSFPWTTCSGCGSHSKYQVDANSDASLRWDAMSSSTMWLGTVLPSSTGDTVPPGGPSRPTQQQSLIQQVWTQAVTSDNTFMCLSSGNIEYIGIRHRGTQTLYLSPPIKRLSIAGYGWLQTGLYLAIIEDAIARFSSGNQPGDTPDDDNTEPMDFDEGANPTHPDPKEGRSGRSGNKRGGRSSGLKTQGSGENMSVDMTTLNTLVNNISTACVRLQYGIYNSVRPSLFIRSHLMAPSPSPTIPSKDLHALVTLTSEIGHGATGNVHGGFLEVNDGRTPISLSIVTKIAFSPEEIQQLEHETCVYRILESAGTRVPRIYGLFREHYDAGDAAALIMSYDGISIEKSNSPVTEEQIESFLTTSKAIHAAGILHGDIDARNLLINDAGETTIIDFAFSVISPHPHKLDMEQEQLSNLLSQVADSRPVQSIT
ncbi:hypothetical protein M405DRAFT_843850 [Rhizopogon salebrosus TDB-379]|nr:hypothetical protein M405DRAFT_843850 [Rhizopogon salebrosus TDB-379]